MTEIWNNYKFTKFTSRLKQACKNWTKFQEVSVSANVNDPTLKVDVDVSFDDAVAIRYQN